MSKKAKVWQHFAPTDDSVTHCEFELVFLRRSLFDGAPNVITDVLLCSVTIGWCLYEFILEVGFVQLKRLDNTGLFQACHI